MYKLLGKMSLPDKNVKQQAIARAKHIRKLNTKISKRVRDERRPNV